MARDVTPFQSFAVAFGFVSIATGIFSAYGAVLTTSGPMGIWTWPVAVLGQLMVALVLGSLAARIPVTGYVYQWASRITNPVFGWIMGWISFTFLAIVLCAVDYTIPSAVLPVLLGYEGTAESAWLITAVVIFGQALMIAFSTKLTQKFNSFAVMVQLVGMIGLIVLLFAVGHYSGLMDYRNLLSTGNVPREGYFSLGTAISVGPWMLGTLLGAFTIVGFESAANLAEETHDPARVIPRAMWQAVLSLGIIGMLFLIAVTALLGDPKAPVSATPIADVITRVLGSYVGKLLLVLVVISIFSCGLVILLSATRLVWAMSRDERFPGWKSLRKISPSLHTPLNATIFITLVGQAILAAFSSDTDALFTLFSAATLLPAIIYAVCVLMYALKRNSIPASQGFTLGAFEVPVLVLAMLWLVFELAIFRDASFLKPWLYVALMLGVGAIYLAGILLLRGGSSALRMPDMISIDAIMDADQGETLVK
ncbi:amino acid permease [Herbaspirillum rubrisubalbicans]|uniref:Amino acid permease n=1 Tax=Herbaspirillum rubrisubalbicans TaxID=80842 RepID=A0ABX9BYZ1_9BURK|nr:amino acid permease [Herbaspirillum rubrisubalbicans]RAN44367.1 amino acid permease [Herbaspirillum rubrisubalbicans]